MSLTGLVLQFSYRLQRHTRLGWPLARWLGLLLLVAAGWALFRWWPFAWQPVALIGLFLGYLLVLAWAARSGYVYFAPVPKGRYRPEETSGVEQSSGPRSDQSPLRPEERVPVRASGWFTVMDQERYFVDVEAAFETVPTREHIVIGRVQPSRFLLLGKWPPSDTGWWYIFFQPATIRGIHPGRLTFGSRSRPALHIQYARDDEPLRAVYLAFDDPAALRRMWDDLLLDAPVG